MKAFWNKFKKLIIPTAGLLAATSLVAVACVNQDQTSDPSKLNNQDQTTKPKTNYSLQATIKDITTNSAQLLINLNNNNNTLDPKANLFVDLINLKTKQTKKLTLKPTNNSFKLLLTSLQQNTTYQLTNFKLNDLVFKQSLDFKTLEQTISLKEVKHQYLNNAINTELIFDDLNHQLNNQLVELEYVSNDHLSIKTNQLIKVNDNKQEVKVNVSFNDLVFNRNWSLNKVLIKNKDDINQTKTFDLTKFKLKPITLEPSKTFVSKYEYDGNKHQLKVDVETKDQLFTNDQIVLLTLDNDQTIESKIVEHSNSAASVIFDLANLAKNKKYITKAISFKNKPANLVKNVNDDLNNSIYDVAKADFKIEFNNYQPLSYIQSIELRPYYTKDHQLVFDTTLSNFNNKNQPVNVILEFVDQNNNPVYSEPVQIEATELNKTVVKQFNLKIGSEPIQNLKYTFKNAWIIDQNQNKTSFFVNAVNSLANTEFKVIEKPLNVLLAYNQIEFIEPQNNSVDFKALVFDNENLLNVNDKVTITLEDENNNIKEFSDNSITLDKNQKWIRAKLTGLNKNTSYKLKSVLVNRIQSSVPYSIYSKDHVNEDKWFVHQFKTLDLEDNKQLEYNKAYETKALSTDEIIKYNKFNTQIKDPSQYNKYWNYFIPENDVYKYAYDMTFALRYTKTTQLQRGNYKTQKVLGTGWILDYVHPKNDEQYPTTFFIATNIHVAGRFFYLKNEVYDTATVPKAQIITSRHQRDGLSVAFSEHLGNSLRRYGRNENLSRNLTEYKIKDFALLYMATNFLDKSYMTAYKRHAGSDQSIKMLPDHAKDFAVLKITFENEQQARLITRDFYNKYKNTPHKFAKGSLLTNDIDTLLNRKDFYIFGYQGQKAYNDVFAQVPTINKSTKDTDFTTGAKLETNHINDNLFLNKYDQIIPGVNNGTITNYSLNFKKATGYEGYNEYFNLMYSIADSSLKPGSSGSAVLNANKEIVGIHFAIVNETDTGLTEPLIFEGLRINDEQILPAFDLINGGMPYQLTSYKQALRKHFSNEKTWLFDKAPELKPRPNTFSRINRRFNRFGLDDFFPFFNNRSSSLNY
ncbi:MIP family Ig-specific serine endopeptidase [Ureaplasma diversum]|uniref:DUF31 domain-containing protein n=1 Tax=Ureaplasma diversum NCTC 246 TaxID=1188241 RepID=A0A084EW91_9BACT|nr:hypothetical protein [Ureaplasma diversum]KEZ22233.1 Hypothetical protein, predicted lipoprotein [Ureaplasma diversum NCTC 246]